MSAHTPLPWSVQYGVGAGWEIFGTLPTGFKFEGTCRSADGLTQFKTWALVDTPRPVLVGCERWVQFETLDWKEMQAANAELIEKAVNNYYELAGCLGLLHDLFVRKDSVSLNDKLRQEWVKQCPEIIAYVERARKVLEKVR